MNSNQKPQSSGQVPRQNEPWYRQFWPWFIIALPASAVIASFISLYLAVSNPDHLVVTDEEYERLRSELKAQTVVKGNEKAEADETDPKSN